MHCRVDNRNSMQAARVALTSICLGMLGCGADRALELPAAPDRREAAPRAALPLEVAAPFRDNAVLQRGIPLRVWGSTAGGAAVTVSYGTQVKNTTADGSGAWEVVIGPLTATSLASVNQVPFGRQMVIESRLGGSEAGKTIENLIVGDVWLCAGQSNMAGKLRTNVTRHHPKDTLARADYPALRQLLPGSSDSWLVCAPDTAQEFKKVAFFFGRRLQRDALVPVGLIVAAVGGSRIETWLNQEPYETGGNYSRLLAPLVGYGIRGVVWYQGESNVRDGRAYRPKLQSLVLGWREVWKQGEFPFYFVQLPGCGKVARDNPAGGGGWADTRQAQFEATSVPNTAMAITIDIGDSNVHPPNKYDTGVRLARLALHNLYGLKDLVPSGPIYSGHKIEGRTIRITFAHARTGLMLAEKTGFAPPQPKPNGALEWLSVKAADGTWHWADGRIDGAELVVSAKNVDEPVAVRYAYVNRATGCFLYNNEGLPAAPFSTCGY